MIVRPLASPALSFVLTLLFLPAGVLPAVGGCARTADPGPAANAMNAGAAEAATEPEDRAAPPVAEIEGVEWRLERLGADDVPPEVVITATFTDGAVSGSSGCNRFTGGYATGDDPRLAMRGPFAGTKRACQPPMGEWENRFLRAFEHATGFALSTAGLLLWAEDGTELFFARAAG